MAIFHNQRARKSAPSGWWEGLVNFKHFSFTSCLGYSVLDAGLSCTNVVWYIYDWDTGSSILI